MEGSIPKKASSRKPVKRASPRTKKQPALKRLTLKSAGNKERTRISIADNTVKKTRHKETAPRANEKSEKRLVDPGKIAVVRSKFELALLSPFRFPMPSERLVGTVARYSGVFFVAVGALFSLVHLQYASGIFEGTTETAQLLTSTMTSTTSGTTGSTDTTTSVDTTPDVRITVEPSGSTVLSSTVPVMVTVADATEVKLLLEDKLHSNTLIQLGTAFKIDNTTWRFYWNTAQYPDGEYRIVSVIKNVYGTYNYTDSTTYQVKNSTTLTTTYTDTTTSTSGTGSVTTATTSTTNTTPTSTTGDSTAATTTNAQAPESTTASTTSSTEISAPGVSLSVLESNPVRGGVDMKVFASNATDVKVYARNTSTLTLYFVGYGTYQSGTTGEWRLTWQSDKVADGTYALTAKAVMNGVTYESAVTKVTVDNVAETTATTSTLTTTTATATTSTEASLKPSIALKLSTANPLAGYVEVAVTTSAVDAVALYLLPKNSLTPYFLGNAQKSSATSWNFLWQTTETPNGDYEIFARVKTAYGTTDGSKTGVRILNEVVTTFTDTQENNISTLSDVTNALIQPTGDTAVIEDANQDPAQPEYVFIQPVESFVGTVEAEDGTRGEIADLLNGFYAQLENKMNDLAHAVREGDEAKVARIKTEIEDLKNKVLLSVPASVEKKEIIDSINTYLSQVAFELQELTIKNETIIKERIGDAISKDSDKDGISDYDEVNLYQTNPFAADTDGDGHIDSAEITEGYNPRDSRSEALVTYESPEEAGIVRDDLLVIDSITTLTPSTNTEKPQPRALIAGKGLPNSFVTLYIFSTPIIVTVKTDAEGSWSYVFDKELEDGEHQVYVGLTDNAGRVVAKSNPLAFVKTAEAFTGSAETGSGDAVAGPSLLAGNVMLLIASIAVVALGLVLILLGLHVRSRGREPEPFVAV